MHFIRFSPLLWRMKRRGRKRKVATLSSCVLTTQTSLSVCREFVLISGVIRTRRVSEFFMPWQWSDRYFIFIFIHWTHTGTTRHHIHHLRIMKLSSFYLARWSATKAHKHAIGVRVGPAQIWTPHTDIGASTWWTTHTLCVHHLHLHPHAVPTHHRRSRSYILCTDTCFTFDDVVVRSRTYIDPIHVYYAV